MCTCKATALVCSWQQEEIWNTKLCMGAACSNRVATRRQWLPMNEFRNL